MDAESKEDPQRVATGRLADDEAKYRGFKKGVIWGLAAMTVVPNLGRDTALLLGEGIVALVLGCLILGGYRGWEAYKKARYKHGEPGASPPQPPPR